MISLSKFKSATLDDLGRRLLKLFEFGAKTAKQTAPFGIDSCPLPEMTAIYARTSNDSESVVIGYIQRGMIAGPGESRLFSLNSDGELKAFVFAKSNGNLELNGGDYSAVRFAPLNTKIQQEIIAKVNAELVKIQSSITGVGGSYLPTPLSLDLSSAESSTVKLK